MNSKKHSEATGGKAKISTKKGSFYSAWDGYISGITIHTEKNKSIVQTWRSSDFKIADTDSLLILTFEQKGKDAILNIVHTQIPNHQLKALKKGWDDFYWKPWKKYLTQ